MISFVINHQPLPKQRPRVGKGGRVYTPTKTRKYENLVAETTALNMQGKEMLTGDLSLSILLYRKGRKRADVDNLIKSVADGMQKVAFNDDQQFVEKHARVIYEAEEPRTVVNIHPVETLKESGFTIICNRCGSCNTIYGALGLVCQSCQQYSAY